MRIQFPDLARPKQAAKFLFRLTAKQKLSSVQEVLSRALGYRDWHELSLDSHPKPSLGSVEVNMGQALRIVLDLAGALDVADADVQYAVSKARLLRERPWALEENLALRAAIWRLRLFGSPGRGRIGTVVRDKACGANSPAYLRRPGRPTYLLFDTGPGERADFEVATPRVPLPDFVPSRLWLPYGYWILKDGSEIIFSRDYFPMWRIFQGRAERLAPWIWINDITEQRQFDAAGFGGWADEARRTLAIEHLGRHRILELPMLIDVMPHLFEADVDSMQDGVRRQYGSSSRNDALPSYAELNRRLIV